MNTPVTNFEALVGQARDCGLTQTFATAYEVNKALDEADCCGGGGSDVWDLSGKITFSSMFNGCKNLIEAPKMITSDGTSFSFMFYNCTNLTTIPLLDTSKGTYFSNMFSDCSSLTTIPPLNTSNGTDFNNMFYWCKNLTTIPQLNTSNGTYFYSMFNFCSSLTTIPQLDTSKGTIFGDMFYKCSNLITIPQIDVSNGTDFIQMFYYCDNLENITFTGSINTSIEFTYCKKLTYESVKSILTACSNTTNTNAKTITFAITLTDQNGELLALVESCTSKGWTISGLTLN